MGDGFNSVDTAIVGGIVGSGSGVNVGIGVTFGGGAAVTCGVAVGVGDGGTINNVSPTLNMEFEVILL